MWVSATNTCNFRFMHELEKSRVFADFNFFIIGYHDRGFHVFVVQSQIYAKNGEEKDSL